MVYKSVADEVKEFLSVSREPKTLKEINTALGNKYTTSDLNRHIHYWVKRGEIKTKIKDGYIRTKEYFV